MTANEVEATEETARAIEAHAERIASAVYARVYTDPFWDARFGKRGHYHTERDGNYHLSYLAQAVRARSARVMAEYALWARGMLVPRGMCSNHLAENFGMIRDALAEHRIAGHAGSILDSAARALDYEDGAAGAIARAAAAVAAALDDPAVPLASSRDWRQHLSYLADAVAAKRPELFADYLGFLDRWQSAAPPSAAIRSRLSAALADRLAPDARDEVQRYVVAA